MGWEDLGLTLRKFFRDLFGSRLSSHLEEELERNRADYEVRITELNQQIANLRAEKAQLSAKVEQCEMVLLPLVYKTAVGPKHPPDFVNLPPDPNSWASIQAQWDKDQNAEEENLASHTQEK